jgi:hypothetical protein
MEEDENIGFFLSAHADMFVVGMLYRGSTMPAVFQAFDAIQAKAVLAPETYGTQFSLANALATAGKAK